MSRGETRLVRNKAGYYEVRWSEGGRSRTVSTRTKNRVEAQAFRAAYVEHERALDRAAPRVTVGEVVEEYLRDRNSTSQYWSARSLLRDLGSVAVSAIDVDTVERYRCDRAKVVRDATVRRELGVLVAAVNRAVRTKRVPREDAPFVDLPPAGVAREVFLDEAEEPVFHAFAMGDSVGRARLSRVTRFVGLALDTGARKAAIEGLTWDRVDFARGLIDFRDPGVAASKKRRVVVPISARLRPTLERAYSERTGEWVLDHNGNMRRTYETWVASTDFAHIHIHDLRRTWASLAVLAGVDLAFVAAVLGDAITTVMKHYAHLRPGHLAAAVNARWTP